MNNIWAIFSRKTIGLVLLVSQTTYATLVLSPLPPSYQGTGTMELNHGSEEGWLIGSKKIFSIGLDWETQTSALFHGNDLGYSTTTYIYSSPSESFRYDFMSGIMMQGLFPTGVIDRDRFLSPRSGYDLLAASSKEPIETLDSGHLVYSRMNPARQRTTFISVEPETNHIQWIETRYDDGSTRERHTYTNWTPLNEQYSIPTTILFDPDNVGGIRVTIHDATVLDNSSPPPPKDLGNTYTIQNYHEMKTYDSDGNFLGDIEFPDSEPSNSNAITKQTAFIGIGIALVLLSGIILAKRK